MDITIVSLLARYPWFGGLDDGYLDAVITMANRRYDRTLDCWSEITLALIAHTIQSEQQGLKQDIEPSTSGAAHNPRDYHLIELERAALSEMGGLFWL